MSTTGFYVSESKSTSEVTKTSNSESVIHVDRKRVATVIAGPTIFFVLAVIPFLGLPYEVRCSIGLLLWMALWWITRPVHLAVTGFLPLATAALFNFVPVERILPAYAAELVILLLSANVLTTCWTRWGLDRRIALASLIGVGTNTTRQILSWFAIGMILSAFLPNTIVAATMIPIVVAMLRFIGIEDLWDSNLGTALVIAVAWGTSAGGATSPLGGAPNLLTVEYIQEMVTGEEFLFATWVTRFLPLSLAVMVVTFIYVRFAFKPEIAEVEGTKEFFLSELKSLGPMSSQEKWGFFLFMGAALLAFSRPLYVELIPALTPAYAFLCCAIVCFLVRSNGENLITWEYAQGKMMWGLFYLFAGGTALGRVLTETGTAGYIAESLLPYANQGGILAVFVFAGLTLLMTQITNNTAAIAITVPITISTFQSLDINPLPFVYIVTTVGNCGFMLPTSAGGPAVAAGYGINLKTMAVKGFWACLLSLIAVVIVGYFLSIYWPTFSTV
ncbi:MAG: Di-and tricarboxylate transporter [Rhodospirillaceae bacterium]|nr:Di-and tricarboxylate transporter [Rhodospirillaceae bacterium]